MRRGTVAAASPCFDAPSTNAVTAATVGRRAVTSPRVPTSAHRSASVAATNRTLELPSPLLAFLQPCKRPTTASCACLDVVGCGHRHLSLLSCTERVRRRQRAPAVPTDWRTVVVSRTYNDA
ncbi:Os03g0664150 [Oryza sativa Japonica Group]|uniref:Os03g0664150 protein n=1 Tax=Oryza sativa subsp. japonica TaxID=39947 RepID=A0A0P0W1V7_ORYSJ|nr:Os03g0664150 [Oryza sativa Japonica Group]